MLGKEKKHKDKIEERAMQTIEQSINKVYDTSDINKEMEKGNEIYLMQDDFFVTHKVECDSFDINELFSESILKWDEIFLGNKKTLNEIVRNINIEKYTGDQIKLDKKYPSKWEYKTVDIEKIKKENKQRYAHSNLEIFLSKINIDVCEPRHNNHRFWRMIASANFFGIPKERILKCRENLLDAYFPKIDEKLLIHINEVTTIEDVKYIWSKIQKKQNAYKWECGEKRINLNSSKKGKSDYLNYKRDKMAYELKQDNPNITRKENTTQTGDKWI